MNRIKLTLALSIFISLIACNNSSSDKNKNEKSKDSTKTGNTALPSAVSAEKLETAIKEAKPVFLVITGTGVMGAENASATVNEAKEKLKNKCFVFSLDRDNAANKELVTKFGIETVPLPFILVISPKGLPVTGGQPEQINADQILKSIPSPKQDDVFIALDKKSPVFVVISQKKCTDKESVLTICNSACAKIKEKPAIVEIDFDNPAEKAFLEQLGVTEMKGSTITVVINSAGQVAETFMEKPSVNQLISAVKKVIKSSGCAPGACAPGSC